MESLEETIKIGILSPLTGASATHGEEGLRGSQMALDELTQLKQQSISIKYIIEDTHSKPSDAVSATRKLIDIDQVKIIVGWLSSSDALAVAPVCERNKTLFFAIGTSTPKLSGSGKYIFRHAPLSSAQATAAARYIVENLTGKVIGILYINDATGRGYYDTFVNSINEFGGNITAVEQYEKTATDMRTQLTKLKEKGCEILYIPCVPRTLGYILKQSKELAFSPQIISNFGAEGQELLDIAGMEANGIIYTSFAMSSNFVDSYKSIYKKSPTMLAALVYDSMNLLFESISQNSDNPDAIAEYLRNIKLYQGVTGSIHFDEFQDAVKQVVFKTVKNNKFIILKKE